MVDINRKSNEIFFEAGDVETRRVALSEVDAISNAARRRMGGMIYFDLGKHEFGINLASIYRYLDGEGRIKQDLVERPTVDFLAAALRTRLPETPSDCLDYFYLREGRLARVGSLGMGNGSLEQALIDAGKTDSVVGIEVNEYEDIVEEGDKFKKVSLSTNGRDFDQLRSEIAEHLKGLDVIILGDSLHHTDDPYKYVRMIWDVMEPGAMCYVSEPTFVPEDHHTRDVRNIEEDSTPHRESMFSLEDHQRWINWLLLKGGVLLHSQFVPGTVAGNRDSYKRVPNVPVPPVEESRKRHACLYEDGLLNKLDDGLNRLRIVFEKPDERTFAHFEIPTRVDQEKKLGELGMGLFDVCPLGCLEINERMKLMAFIGPKLFTPDYFDHVEYNKVLTDVIGAFRPDLLAASHLNPHAYSGFMFENSPIDLKRLGFYDHHFGEDDELMMRAFRAGEVSVLMILLNQHLGIEIFDRAEVLYPNFREFQPFDYNKHLYDPYELLADLPVGIDTHYPHPCPTPEVMNGLMLEQRAFSNTGARQFAIPEHEKSEIADKSGIFDVWPLSLVKEGDIDLVFDEMNKHTQPDDVVSVLPKNAEYSELLEFFILNLGGEGMKANYMEELHYSLKIICRLRETDPLVDRVLLLAKLLSDNCKLGYVVDLIAKTGGWALSPIALHPESMKQMV